MLVFIVQSLLVSHAAAVSLFNGSEALVLPSTTSSGCLNAFGTAINCQPQYIQLLTSPDDQIGWTTSQLQSLCTSNCKASLSSLGSTVASACGTSSFNYGNSGNLTYTQLIELRQFKYDIACMQDTSTQKYCLDVEKSWNITSLAAQGSATWPKATSKIYPNLRDSDSDAEFLTFVNGTSLPLDWVQPSLRFSNALFQNNVSRQGNPAGLDWYKDRGNQTYSNYGWPYALNYDEYPLEIQCTSCFLQKLQYSINSVYGMVYDQVMAQVWSNIQKNCQISTKLAPAHDYTAINASTLDGPRGLRSLNGTAYCPRYIKASDASQNVTVVAAANSVPLAALLEMNNIYNGPVGSASICAPDSCALGIVSSFMSARNYVAQFQNMTIIQFLQWNPYADANSLVAGESVCVGPPGGAYQPALATPANATVYSTTAVPATPTTSGSIKYCGLWYNVTTGDYCNLLSQKFKITFDQMRGMNPALNQNCTNLFLGYDYCMAPCCGSSIPPAPMTTSMTSSSTSVSQSVTSTYATPPGPTQSGASNKCYKWYTAQSGDYCSKIWDQFQITSKQWYAWNPEVNANCDIQAGLAYCVNGPPV